MDWLIYVNLTQARLIREKRTSIEKMQGKYFADIIHRRIVPRWNTRGGPRLVVCLHGWRLPTAWCISLLCRFGVVFQKQLGIIRHFCYHSRAWPQPVSWTLASCLDLCRFLLMMGVLFCCGAGFFIRRRMYPPPLIEEPTFNVSYTRQAPNPAPG